jgi:hypothetical protein
VILTLTIATAAHPTENKDTFAFCAAGSSLFLKKYEIGQSVQSAIGRCTLTCEATGMNDFTIPDIRVAAVI